MPHLLLAMTLLLSAPAGATQQTDDLTTLMRDFYTRIAPTYDAPVLPQTAPPMVSPLPMPGSPTLQPVPARRGGSNRLADGTALLLTVRIDRDRLLEPLMVMTEGPGFRVSLDLLVQAFEFPIIVDAQAGRASGWFIRPDNEFSLDMAAGTVTSRGRVLPIRDGEVVSQNGELLIGDWVLPAWFGLEASVNLADLEVSIVSEEPLPAQARQRREKHFAQRQSFNVPKSELPAAPDPAPLFGPPVIDLLASGRIIDSKYQDSQISGSYAITSASDFLGGSLTSYLSGTEEDPLSSRRATLSYYDAEGLGGIGWITQARLGDTVGVSTTLLSPSASGQGLYLSNLPIGSQIRSDSTVITGDALPGYEVELYRDDQLVGYQRVGGDGVYRFEDVELFGGDNQFRIVLYGPQGQRDEIVRSIPTGGELGAFPLTYQFAASRIDKGPDEGAFQSSLTTRLAVTDWLAFLSGAGTTVYNDQRISDALVGAQLREGRLLAEGLIGRDTLGRTIGRAVVQTRIDDTSLRLSHQVQPEAVRLDTQNRERTEAAISGTLPGGLFSLPYLRYTLGAERVSDSIIEDGLSFSARLGTQIGRTSLNNDVLWVNSTSRATEFVPEQDREELQFFHQANFPLGRLRNRFRIGYAVAPEFNMREFQANTIWLMDQNLTSELDVRHQFDQKRTVTQARVNYDMGQAILSPRISYENSGVISAFLDVRLSTGLEPMTGRVRMQSRPSAHDGSIAVMVFLDEDGDGQLGPDEERLEGVEIQAPQARRSALTDETGVAMLRNVQPFETSDVRIIPSSLPSSALMPGIDGYSVSVLPGGSRTMELPVVRSWSVEGRAWSVATRSEGAALVGVQVVALAADSDTVIASTVTAGDGTYSIAGLRQGRYRIALAADGLGGGLVPGPARPLATDPRETTYHAVDLVAAAPGQAPYYPALQRSAGLGPLMLPLGATIQEPTAEAEATRKIIAIRLGQYRSRLSLIMGWDELLGETGPLLAGLVPILSRREEARLLGDRTSLYPFRLGPLPDRQAAEAICDGLRETGRSCVPTLVDWHDDRLAQAADQTD
ncbi:MAG: carboxypeptidase-like regulatory domain-containing protein [Alphaproteobacteria bacterium]|nr:carboxypeptidase-like regulatory domain-containing protein [Alphaproteobacteria bacterium]MBU0797497.1 carboxypeptidase-like regulatory domain-containing protein [Alphaproteobacteria bacterium]MBU0889074.1 carboxypeptidase-like regulatory domain-containing protein [Alphaproteobacteria bacterium]MBU1813258.1 carboxypeptidase-like regulatory domain-containing protein [Alphaproteobacteria bacterium]